MTALIAAEHLGRDFAARSVFGRARSVQAVSDVTLSIARGESVALVGESGSGKTTLCRMLLGLLRPTAGRISFDGMDLATVGAAQQRALA